MKPRVLMVTRIPFWLLGAGERMRILALAWVLSKQTEFTLFFLGNFTLHDAQQLTHFRVKCKVFFQNVDPNPAKNLEVQLQALRELCTSNSFDCCILERMEMVALLPALPPGMKTVLDTHDLESGKLESRAAQGLETQFAVSFATEMDVLLRFDRVMLIQSDDYARTLPLLGQRALLAPHPVQFQALPVQPERRRLGMVASSWAANLHGLDWFTEHVWPLLATSDTQVHLYGWIGDVWRPDFSGYVRHGFVGDFKVAWGGIDVAINPVRWGSGLKIKCVEALGHGLPLVTTCEGARGLMNGAGSAFCLADDPATFASACRALLDNAAKRTALGQAAYQYANTYFSPQACFGELIQWLKS